MGHTTPGCDWTDDPETFTDALDDLKNEGCLLLVLESASSHASHAGCRRMLADDALDDRRRLFVSTDDDASRQHGPRPGGSGGQRAITYRTVARGAVGVDAGATTDPPTTAVPTTTVRSDVDDLADAVEAEVDALAPPDGFDPGQLRVCVDALDELLSDADLLDVLEFTRTLRAVARDADGIAHVHVGTHVPAMAVEGLLPQFDAVVEVADDDDPRQRWHLPDESLSTEWLEL